MQSQPHLISISLIYIMLLWPLQSAGIDTTPSAALDNTPPQIMEGEQLKITLQEDNSDEATGQPTAYAFVLTASDAEYDKLTWALAAKARHGSISMTGSNNVQTINYTPSRHYHGTDSFKVLVSDVFKSTDIIDISILIHPVNDEPTSLGTKNIEVPYGSPIQAYRLDKYFYDVDNERHEMTYDVAENTHPNIVHPQIRKNFIELTYKQSGYSQIAIKATDPEGLYTSTMFYITVMPVESEIKLLRSFPPLSQISQPVVLFFQVTSPSGVNPTGLVTVSNGVQSCHYKLKPENRGKGLCRITLSEYQDYIFHAEYAGDNNFSPSSTQQDFIHKVQPKVLIYHTKPRKEYELSEDGMGDSYAISLSQIPTAAVELSITPDQQLSINGAEVGQAVSFILEDTQPVNIFLVPTDDEMVEGWHQGTVQHQTQSKDRDYHNLTSVLRFPIQDNDAGIVIKQTNGGNQLIEEETTDSYAIYLSTVPQKPVNIKILPYDNQVMVYPNNLLFDTETWYQAQNIQISAIPDNELEGEHSATLSHLVRTQDMIYANEHLAFSVDGKNTNTIDITIIDNDAEQPPLAPDKLVAKVLVDNQVLLKWQDNSDNEEHFVLKRDGVKLAELAENARAYQDIEVRCNTMYAYELFSVNKKGRSLESTKSSVQTVLCSELKAPDDLVSFPLGNQYINLIWIDTNNSEDGYIIERDGQLIGKTTAHTVGYRDSNFTCSMTYNYTVKAYRLNGKESPPAHTTISTQPCKGKFTLTLKIDGHGSVNGCTTECVQVYPEKQSLDFQIRASNNWKFDHWEGHCDVAEQLVMNSDKICTAYFMSLSELE
ncbi:Ig-like domain-containing protein [Candidatus Albibeggiatoa sp. nov. BB20]|uniref:Ig-like domain-containing protein n=1 Tax=Candidatus Albibeggiatoa sp. nov. BB20 TaxID=3162723 RepID=UPI0033658F3D